MEKLQQVSAVVKCHLKEKTATVAVMSYVSLWFILIVPNETQHKLLYM